MKILLTFFVLLFSSSVVADDISDFQIEGMSVGDSLLDYFSEKEINDNIRNIYVDKKFTMVSFYNLPFFKTYENIDVHYLTEDNSYKIYSIAGNIFYPENISECYKKMNTLDNELQPITHNANLISDQVFIHINDPTGKSKIKPIVYEMVSGDWIGLQCYDFSNEYILNQGVTDNLEVFLEFREFNYWLSNNPYKG